MQLCSVHINVFIQYLQVIWNDSGELVCIAGEESYFILKYQADEVVRCMASHEGIDSDGIEVAFDVSLCVC